MKTWVNLRYYVHEFFSECELLQTKVAEKKRTYVGHLESKERLRIQPAQLFNFS